jgi:V8-like Glu-specific endopeptidase
MVSEWQVLTALHVVECKSAIATIRVTTGEGKRYHFSPEKEWKDNDVARIQMSSGDSFNRDVSPPTLRLTRLTRWEPVYIQAAHPDREEIIGEATGYAYGGSGYGGSRDTRYVYKAATQKGNSGSAVYDINGDLVCIHVGYRADDTKECGTVTEEMLPR